MPEQKQPLFVQAQNIHSLCYKNFSLFIIVAVNCQDIGSGAKLPHQAFYTHIAG